MPSESVALAAPEERLEAAARVFAPSVEVFSRALVLAAEEIRGFLGAHVGVNDGASILLRQELGPFAAGRLDAGRLAEALPAHAPLSPAAAEALRQAHDVLRAQAARAATLSRIDLPSGGRLGAAVDDALAEIGRAFSAARTAMRMRRAPDATDLDVAGPFPYRRWSAAERRIAPPLVVALDGADLAAGEIASVLDGAQKLVLLVRGESTSAPLVRLVTPRTFVVQTATGAALDRLAAYDGPGIAALLPETAAEFVHDPARGLDVTRLPAEAPRRAVGGVSAEQQAEELRQLRALAAETERERSAAQAGTGAASASAPAAAGAAPPDVDRVAAWLLSLVTAADLA